jgi:hypothetical protein
MFLCPSCHRLVLYCDGLFSPGTGIIEIGALFAWYWLGLASGIYPSMVGACHSGDWDYSVPVGV